MNSAFLSRVEWTGTAFAVAVIALWAIFGTTYGAGVVAVGAAVGLGNFFLIRHLVGRFLEGGQARGGLLGGIMLAKFLAVALVFYLLVVVLELPIVPLTLGVSLVFPAVMFEVLRRGLEAPNAPSVSGGEPDLL